MKSVWRGSRQRSTRGEKIRRTSAVTTKLWSAPTCRWACAATLASGIRPHPRSTGPSDRHEGDPSSGSRLCEACTAQEQRTREWAGNRRRRRDGLATVSWGRLYTFPPPHTDVAARRREKPTLHCASFDLFGARPEQRAPSLTPVSSNQFPVTGYWKPAT